MGRIDAATKQASALLDDTHRFVRGKPQESERVDACKVASEVAELMEGTFPRITMPTTMPDGPAHVQASPRRLFDGLMHLVLNAFEAMNHKGEIRLQVRRTDGQVVLAVSDSGPGIAGGDLERALEPGTTGGGESFTTGLGLPAAAAIARQMGGSLELESPQGGGLRAELRLPEVGS
jgi:signal transduction histidine kinase